MKSIDECFVLSKNIPKLTKANSAIIQGRVIYIVKENYAGKSSCFFHGYDFDTKIQLAFHKNKNGLIDFLSRQNLGVLSENNNN